MRISKLQGIVPALMVTCALALTASPALAKQEGKTKVKSTEKIAKENSGRKAGELPAGLQKYTEKKGQLPSGLQKKKDEEGQLTKGLEKGGKKVESSAKSSKPSK
jgi:Skp family chaperone for outer membrane proteins